MISARGLTRTYGPRTAVAGISLEVPAGSICSFLGPNGAGKSTTVKLLTGLLLPTSGEARIAGLPPQQAKHLIGVLPENLGLFEHLTVEEHLHLSGPIYGLTRRETHSRAGQLLDALGLENARSLFASQCSHGMRKKTALAMALLHNPRVLFLDEPFEGIDPVTSKTIRDLLAALAGRGMTIFMTSHILSIVERLASQIVFIRQGHIVWNSTPDQLPQGLEDHYFALVESAPARDLPWLASSQS
ncbi:MAG: ABC transporter ATP-binding protein [Bryobacterales bacterium]|nr:ABC transporter ATP-binding protein [Bryobacterales bacterium]